MSAEQHIKQSNEVRQSYNEYEQGYEEEEEQ